jgi:hypothetical protein
MIQNIQARLSAFLNQQEADGFYSSAPNQKYILAYLRVILCEYPEELELGSVISW